MRPKQDIEDMVKVCENMLLGKGIQIIGNAEIDKAINSPNNLEEILNMKRMLEWVLEEN